jgi:hypothetical protein
MVEFITIDDTEIKFGENNFFEVAHKKAVSEDEVKHFVSITRGYYKDGIDKKFTKAISIPMDGKALSDMINALSHIHLNRKDGE